MLMTLLHLADERPDSPELQTVIDTLNQAALDVASSMGWETKLVAALGTSIDETLRAVEEADVIVIMGGEDVSPERYGGSDDYPGAGRYLHHADDAHIAAIRAAKEAQKPMLGICRGNQLINVAFGGTLISHLVDETHLRPGRTGFAKFQPRTISAEPELAGDIADEPVNCGHHQAIDRLGEGLRVVARADDGIIEAIVHDSAPITGVQWHPERPEAAFRQLPPLFRRLERQLSERTAATKRKAPATA